MKNNRVLSFRAKSELIELLVLALPACASQFGIFMLSVTDTVIVAHYSVEALSAVIAGNAWAIGTLIFTAGVVFGADPIIGQACGAGDYPRASLAFQRSIVVSVLLSAITCILWFLTKDVLLLFGQTQQVAEQAHQYVLIQLPSVPAIFAYLCMRQYLQGRRVTGPIVVISVLANIINLVGNLVLVFGYFGFPELGLIGAAIATSVTRLFMAGGLLLWFYFGRKSERTWFKWTKAVFNGTRIREILKIGVPAGLVLGLESTSGQIAALMAGNFDEIALAAHGTITSMSAVSYALMSGISFAAATRVSHMLGIKHTDVKGGTYFILLSSGLMISLLSMMIFLFRKWLPALFTGDASVIELVTSVIPLLSLHQVFDGFQIVACGVLRGYGLTTSALMINLAGHFVIGLPLGYFLMWRTRLGLVGLWLGLTIGMLVVAVGLLVTWLFHKDVNDLETENTGTCVE